MHIAASATPDTRPFDAPACGVQTRGRCCSAGCPRPEFREILFEIWAGKIAQISRKFREIWVVLCSFSKLSRNLDQFFIEMLPNEIWVRSKRNSGLGQRTGFGFAALTGGDGAADLQGKAVAEGFGPVVVDVASPCFRGAERHTNNTAELTSCVEAMLWLLADAGGQPVLLRPGVHISVLPCKLGDPNPRDLRA